MSSQNTNPKLDEEEYYRSIDKCAAEGLDQPISNALPEHARYLMSKMFSLATRKVRLYSGRLVRKADPRALECGKENEVAESIDVYAATELLTAVRGFLGKDGNPELQIVVQNEIDGGVDSHPMFALIREMQQDGSLRGSVEVRKVPQEYTSLGNHFMVMDDSAYRFEIDHEPCKAQANFGDSRNAKMLADLFDANLFPSGAQVFAVTASR